MPEDTSQLDYYDSILSGAIAQWDTKEELRNVV